MSFFVILILYFLYRRSESWHKLQKLSIFQRWWQLCQKLPAKASVLFYLLIPCLAVVAFDIWLTDVGTLGRWLLVGIDVLVLIQLLGSKSLESHFNEACDMVSSGSLAEAGNNAATDLGYDAPSDSFAAAAMVSQQLARQAFVDFFAVLFWYWVGEALLGYGVALALVWRLAYFIGRDDSLAAKLLHLLSWIPARLALLGYAFVGNFSKTLPVLIDSLTDINIRASRLLHDGAQAALSGDEFDNEETGPFWRLYQLIQHSELVWLAAFSLLALAGA